jgi:ADP-heptose:LPS heptosyltransferase
MAEPASRFGQRARVVAHAVSLRATRGPRTRPGEVRRVLVAHHLLAGDTLMLTPLVAKLRERYPVATIVLLMRPGLVPLYAGQPYGVHAAPYDPRRALTFDELLRERGFDLAYVPGDNRYSWLAAALDSSWIVAFGGDRPAHKSWMVDELVAYPAQPMAWSDMNTLLVEGPAPHPYRPSDWPLPPCTPFEHPAGRFAVLHVEASTPLKQWEETKWLHLAAALEEKGIRPVWSAGRDGTAYLARIDPARRYPALGQNLDLVQLWNLVARAALLVSVDTSVAHIGKHTFTPTVTLFGPSSATLFGAGEFWRDAPFHAAGPREFPCRDQRTLFKREIEWVRRCQRSTAECAAPRCMQSISVDDVMREVLRAIP